MGADLSEARCPLVTIGIPSYNSARFIEQAVDSALAQTYRQLEVLVIDDVSEDETWSSLLGFSDPRLRILRNDANLGAVGNWNRVLAEAQGEFIKVLHADDFIEPEAIEALVVSSAEDSAIVLASSRRWIVNEGGCRMGTRGARWPRGRIDGRQAVQDMARTGRNLIGEPSATLMRTEAARRVGGFDSKAGYCVDLDLWTRMLVQGDLYFCDTPLASYRVSRGQWSVELAARQSADFRHLLTRLQEEPKFDVSKSDAHRGARAAARQAILRRILYVLLPKGTRKQSAESPSRP
ncbi:MAG: glycosyltransferase [Actinomycetota bacterium]|nr:glycosyltransferase [Actinomycetota bacterium]